MSTLCCISCHTEALGNKFDPVIRMVKDNLGSSFEEIGGSQVPSAVHQVSRSSASWFRKRRFLKFLTIYGHGHVGQIFIPHIPWRAPYEIWLQSAWRFLRKEGVQMLNLSDLG